MGSWTENPPSTITDLDTGNALVDSDMVCAFRVMDDDTLHNPTTQLGTLGGDAFGAFSEVNAGSGALTFGTWGADDYYAQTVRDATNWAHIEAAKSTDYNTEFDGGGTCVFTIEAADFQTGSPLFIGTSAGKMDLKYNSGTTYECEFLDSTGALVTFSNSTKHVVAITFGNGSMEVFLDGTSQNTASGGPDTGATAEPFWLGAQNGSPTDGLTAKFSTLLFWTRKLSEPEITSISSNPWQIWADAAGVSTPGIQVYRYFPGATF